MMKIMWIMKTTWNSAHFTLHSSHSTLHSSHSSHFTLHSSHSTVHTSHCTLQSSHFALAKNSAKYVFFVACALNHTHEFKQGQLLHSFQLISVIFRSIFMKRWNCCCTGLSSTHMCSSSCFHFSFSCSLKVSYGCLVAKPRQTPPQTLFSIAARLKQTSSNVGFRTALIASTCGSATLQKFWKAGRSPTASCTQFVLSHSARMSLCSADIFFCRARYILQCFHHSAFPSRLLIAFPVN